jgi:hypothetical protein
MERRIPEAKKRTCPFSEATLRKLKKIPVHKSVLLPLCIIRKASE